jgi:hypothetical protein
MAHVENTKASAWDLIGGLFWAQGRATARPTAAEIDIFLSGLTPGARIAVVGASTKALVEAALTRRFQVTVLDFSTKMCRDLADEIGSSVDIRLQDITDAIPEDLVGAHEIVISDRLINRFTHDEGIRALSGMLGLLSEGGLIRTSVKLGLYPMDLRMIAEGLRRDTLEQFYNPDTRTIDFSAAGDVLETCLLPHGNIDRETLLGWYRRRGRESRFEDTDIRAMSAQARAGKLYLANAQATPFPDAKETMCYAFVAIGKESP